MLYHALFAGLGLAGLAAAAPTKRKANDQTSGPQNVVYWGARGNSSLSDYCAAGTSAGIDVLVLSFLNTFGASGDIPSGVLGGCIITADGSFDTAACSTLASSIKTCQSAGKKVIVSLGGGMGSYSLASQSQAETIGQYLWDAYGNSGNTAVKRPFGDVFVNGWDFDLENPDGGQWYQYLISTLRSNIAKDPSNKYYITGAPQCPLPEANMGAAIQNSVFDYLFIQFYNNPQRCSLNAPGSSPLNWGEWTKFLSSTKSSSAKIFVGAPAAPGGAGSGFVEPSHLATVVNSVKSDPSFGGVMLWDASWSDEHVVADCTFAQQVKSILTTGKTCKGTPDDGGSPPPPASNSTVPSPAYSAPASSSSTPATSSATYSPPASTSPASSLPDNSSLHASGSSGNGGGVAQWGQCGGIGYTGPIQCQSPYKCVQEGQYWSSCQ
ncbi:glycosylhydrolase family 18-1 [Trichoderma gamsii]|uniref:Glycosylhydrolase family 18-1 n=1 Tax=Trichoderma gamsii TaxID=398673 RepID=A0A0W7VHK7_9HYPO|nr:glycosylhydrolase family 18-1 [Trichoderma gamsii]PNP41171.1 hypothetical protein TGAMA5MH_07041 [Trichoderma gamsii]PON22783.1 glycosylhydrolase family 18-1 [Trichoderma gamsii]